MKNYLRYTDDFVVVAESEDYLIDIINPIASFLRQKLKLELHPKKVSIRKFQQGIDFLGYIVLPHYQRLRTKTKQRIFRKLKLRTQEYKDGKITKESVFQSLQSYFGVLSHANEYKLTEELKNQFWFWLTE